MNDPRDYRIDPLTVADCVRAAVFALLITPPALLIIALALAL